MFANLRNNILFIALFRLLEIIISFVRLDEDFTPLTVDTLALN